MTYVTNNSRLRHVSPFDSRGSNWIEAMLKAGYVQAEGLTEAQVRNPGPLFRDIIQFAAENRDCRYVLAGYNDVYKNKAIDCSGLVTYFFNDLLGISYPKWINCPNMYKIAKDNGFLIPWEEAVKKVGNIILIQGEPNYTTSGSRGRCDPWGNHYGHMGVVVDESGAIMQTWGGAHRNKGPGDIVKKFNAKGQPYWDNISTIQITGPKCWAKTTIEYPNLPAKIGVDIDKYLDWCKKNKTGGVKSGDSPAKRGGSGSGTGGEKSGNEKPDGAEIPVWPTTPNIPPKKEAPITLPPAEKYPSGRPEKRSRMEEIDWNKLKIFSAYTTFNAPPVQDPFYAMNYVEDLKQLLDSCDEDFSYDHNEVDFSLRYGIDPYNKDLLHFLRFMLYVKSAYGTKKNMFLTGYHKHFLYHRLMSRNDVARVLWDDLSEYMYFRLANHNSNSSPDNSEFGLHQYFDFPYDPRPKQLDIHDREDFALMFKMLDVCGFKNNATLRQVDTSLASLADVKYGAVLFGQHSLVSVNSYSSMMRTPTIRVQSVVLTDNKHINDSLNDLSRVSLLPTEIVYSGGTVTRVALDSTNRYLQNKGLKELQAVMYEGGGNTSELPFLMTLLYGLSKDAWTPIDITLMKGLWNEAMTKVVGSDLAKSVVDYVRGRFNGFTKCDLNEFVFLPSYKKVDGNSFPKTDLCHYRPNLLLTVLGYGLYKGKDLFIHDIKKVRDRRNGISIRYEDNPLSGSRYVMDLDDAEGGVKLMNYF